MKCLCIILLLCVISKFAWSLYPPSDYGQQERLYKQIQIQKQIQYLQQQLNFLQEQENQSQTSKATESNSILPKPKIVDFEYVPTVQGFKFSYQLPDGSRREENAVTTGPHVDIYSRLYSKTTDFSANDVGGRPIMTTKNRKLSPSSLRGLAG